MIPPPFPAPAECPLCRGPATRSLGPHPDFASTQLHACASCAFWFGAPAPAPAELRRYYENTYGQRRTWSRSREYLALMQRRAAAQWAFLAPAQSEIRSAVDVGCGVGALVSVLAAAGVDAVGYDSDPTVIAIGRARLRANIQAEYVAAPAGEARARDLLCLSHVVEHLAAPVAELGRLLEWVQPRGWIFVEVPNSTEPMVAPGCETESHLGFYTTRALGQLADRLDLEVVKLEVCGPVLADYYRDREVRLKALAAQSRAIWARLERLPARLGRRLLSPRTEFDGDFATASAAGDPPRLWLRALLRRRGAPPR